jgi:hypothetical protein
MESVDITAITPAAAEQWRTQFGGRPATFTIFNGGAYISAHDAGNRLYHWWPGIERWQGPECKP